MDIWGLGEGVCIGCIGESSPSSVEMLLDLILLLGTVAPFIRLRLIFAPPIGEECEV